MENRRIEDSILLEQIRGLKELIQERFDRNEDGHARLIEQTTKTNGRVTALEVKTDSIKSWQDKAIGALIICQVFVLPILIWLVVQHLDKSQ